MATCSFYDIHLNSLFESPLPPQKQNPSTSERERRFGKAAPWMESLAATPGIPYTSPEGPSLMILAAVRYGLPLPRSVRATQGAKFDVAVP
jgi:hypothetical protein